MPISTSGDPAIFINPLQVALQALEAVTFVATISNGTGTLAWSVDGIVGGNATIGTVDSSGNYVAGSQAGKHVVSATAAVGDFNPFANAAVNIITSAPAVTVVTTAPTAASYIGAVVFNSATGVAYTYTSAGWIPTASPVAIVTAAPTTPSYLGALVFDSVTSVLYIYTSGGWVVA